MHSLVPERILVALDELEAGQMRSAATDHNKLAEIVYAAATDSASSLAFSSCFSFASAIRP
jgi:hypothetical protein